MGITISLFYSLFYFHLESPGGQASTWNHQVDKMKNEEDK